MERDQHGRFAAGNTFGAAGRPPKGMALTDILREALEDPSNERDERLAIASKLVELAKDGDMEAIKYVFNRIDGMPKQRQEHSGAIEIDTIGALLQGRDAKR